MRLEAADSNTTELPSRLTTGRRLSPAKDLATAEVVPAGPQSTPLAGGRVVGVVPGAVVPGVPGAVVPGVPPGFGEPGPLGGWIGSGAVFCGAAAMPTMARLSRRLPAEP